MKEGWSVKTLGEISVMMADGPFGSNLKKEHYTEDHEVRIIQLSNIGEDGWREENTKYTTFKHLETIKRSEVFPDDIVIAKMMPAGRAIICPSHEKKFVLSSDAVKVQIKKGFHLRFILHSINSPYFREQVYENVSGSGRVRTSLTKLRECHLRLPPFAEQQRIADLLDTAFAKIDALKLNAERTLLSAKVLFQATLKRELEPKDGWLTALLGDISSIARGGSPRPIKAFITDKPDGVNWIKIGDTEVGGKYIYSTKEKIKREGMRSSRYVEPGDFLLSNSMSFGRPYILKTDGCIHDGWLVIKKYESSFSQDFLYYLLLSPIVVKQFEEGARGSTVRNLNTDIVSAVKVSYPSSLKEQEEIVEKIEEQKIKCKSLQDNYSQIVSLCDDLKQSLLRKAFDGEL